MLVFILRDCTYWLDVWETRFGSWWGLVFVLFSTVSRLVLGPAMHPVIWVPGNLSVGDKWLGHEAEHCFH